MGGSVPVSECDSIALKGSSFSSTRQVSDASPTQNSHWNEMRSRANGMRSRASSLPQGNGPKDSRLKCGPSESSRIPDPVTHFSLPRFSNKYSPLLPGQTRSRSPSMSMSMTVSWRPVPAVPRGESLSVSANDIKLAVAIDVEHRGRLELAPAVDRVLLPLRLAGPGGCHGQKESHRNAEKASTKDHGKFLLTWDKIPILSLTYKSIRYKIGILSHDERSLQTSGSAHGLRHSLVRRVFASGWLVIRSAAASHLSFSLVRRAMLPRWSTELSRWP